jgi:glycosyltransferase involved in cell wall biosynthesis
LKSQALDPNKALDSSIQAGALYTGSRLSDGPLIANSPMKISVIVPAFNEEKLLAESLRAIRSAMSAFTERAWETELIVCDNNSSDRTAKIAKEEGAAVVFEPVNQISRARNTGARSATGDWLLFIDADSLPSAALLAGMAGEISGGDCLAGGSTVQMDDGGVILNCLAFGWNAISRLRRWAAGSFVFVETEAFRELNGFSEELYASEEIELFQRLKRLARVRGKRIVILTKHPLSTSARKVKLYSMGEWLRFFVKLVLGLGRPLKSRKACHVWYDGRR